MPPEIFLFSCVADPQPFERFVEAQRRTNAARSGKKYTLVRGDVLEFRASFSVAFPQPDSVGLTYRDYLDFVAANKAKTFLFMPYTGPTLHREEQTNIVTDGVQTEFSLDHKWVDSSSARAWLDTGGGEVEISPASFSITGNGVAPKFIFSSAPAAGVLRLRINFYVPMIFADSPAETGEGLADPRKMEVDAPRQFAISLIEEEPGARFVNPTGASSSA